MFSLVLDLPDPSTALNSKSQGADDEPQTMYWEERQCQYQEFRPA